MNSHPFFPNIQIYQTSKSGLGIRTTRVFRRGEIVCQYPGDLITTRHEHNLRELKYSKSSASYMFMFRWKDKTYWYVCLAIIQKFFIGFIVTIQWKWDPTSAPVHYASLQERSNYHGTDTSRKID